MEQSIVAFLERILPDATSIAVEDFQQIAGGFSMPQALLWKIFNKSLGVSPEKRSSARHE